MIDGINTKYMTKDKKRDIDNQMSGLFTVNEFNVTDQDEDYEEYEYPSTECYNQ